MCAPKSQTSLPGRSQCHKPGIPSLPREQALASPGYASSKAEARLETEIPESMKIRDNWEWCHWWSSFLPLQTAEKLQGGGENRGGEPEGRVPALASAGSSSRDSHWLGRTE